ncbi:MAG: lysophospholipase L1-like esterase [Candidatus Azotimanducaceae bacterium]
MNQNKIWLFRLISVAFGLTAALIIGELILQVYAGRITGQDRMDEGLIQYHSQLGWKLSRGWHGMHNHVDYDVEYSTDRRGLRQNGSAFKSGPEPLLVLGDSFTFGLGVNDQETFVAQLNSSQSIYEFFNGGVPGYSPDQVLLWSKSAVEMTQPVHVLFFLYLGNDLIDLALPFPIQAGHGKPYADIELDGSGIERLVIRNMPVPMMEKPPELKGQTLGSYLLGPEQNKVRYGLRVLDFIAVQFSSVDERAIDILQQKISPSVALFKLVYAEFLNEVILAQNISGATLVLLPGSSLINDPSSISGTYQSLLTTALTNLAANENWELIDLGEALKASSDGMYFPNDGHLSPAGHKLVAAKLLKSSLFSVGR